MAVRKRAVRAEKKKRRMYFAALFVLLAAVAAAVLLYAGREKELPVIESAQDESVTFVSRTAAEVASLTVENSEGVYTVTQENGVAAMAGRADFVFSEHMLAPLLDNAALVYADRKIMDLSGSGYDFRDFGLEEKSIRVQVRYTDGSEIAFRIGDLIPQDKPEYYLRVEGDTGLYAVSMDVQECYMLSADALHAVTDPALNAELIDRIAFTGENPFAMAYEDGAWRLTEPFNYPLSTAKVNTFLEKLENIRFAQYVAPEGKADLPSLGLAPARRTMTLTIAESILTGYDEFDQAIASQRLPGYELAFHCGKDKGEVLFYCLYRGDVVLATRFSAAALLTQSYETLLTDAPFAMAVGELTRLEWEADGQTRAWDITLHERVLPNNDFERDESGNILYDVRVWQAGKEQDSDAFLLFYSRLVDVKTTHALPGDYAVPAERAKTIRMHHGGRVREIALYPYGELHYAVSVDGHAAFYISREEIDTIKLP